jgi:hypothetical protein
MRAHFRRSMLTDDKQSWKTRNTWKALNDEGLKTCVIAWRLLRQSWACHSLLFPVRSVFIRKLTNLPQMLLPLNYATNFKPGKHTFNIFMSDTMFSSNYELLMELLLQNLVIYLVWEHFFCRLKPWSWRENQLFFMIFNRTLIKPHNYSFFKN